MSTTPPHYHTSSPLLQVNEYEMKYTIRSMQEFDDFNEDLNSITLRSLRNILKDQITPPPSAGTVAPGASSSSAAAAGGGAVPTPTVAGTEDSMDCSNDSSAVNARQAPLANGTADDMVAGSSSPFPQDKPRAESTSKAEDKEVAGGEDQKASTTTIAEDEAVVKTEAKEEEKTLGEEVKCENSNLENASETKPDVDADDAKKSDSHDDEKKAEDQKEEKTKDDTEEVGENGGKSTENGECDVEIAECGKKDGESAVTNGSAENGNDTTDKNKEEEEEEDKADSPRKLSNGEETSEEKASKDATSAAEDNSKDKTTASDEAEVENDKEEAVEKKSSNGDEKSLKDDNMEVDGISSAAETTEKVFLLKSLFKV